MIDLITELLKFFNNLFNRPSKQINKVVRIYDSLHRLIEETKIQRILIIKAHNGGGLIKPDNSLYISVLYEDYTHPLDTIRNDYQKIEVDEEYVRMLRDLSFKKYLRININGLKSGMLKDAYQKDDIRHAEAHFLGQDRRNVYFCTLVTTEEGEEFDSPLQRATISVVINSIKNNLK